MSSTPPPASDGLNTENEKKREEKKDWRVVGVHRPLGGYWYNFTLDLGGLLLSFVMLSVILPLILPYSETLGFNTVVTSLFKLTFTLADVGVGSAVNRFVAERSARDPKGAVRYVQFFIWFQMFTGLLQVTGIALYVLTWIPQTNMNYLAWFMLAYSTIQYPGMLSVYQNALKGFQRYNKAYIVGFIQGVLLQVTTQVVCVILGRVWGSATPMYGEMFGATLGWVVGAYLDDFIAMAIGARMFSGVLGEYNISFWDTLKFQFTRQEAVDCFKYGVKTMGASVASNVYSLVSTLIFVNVLPAYASWIGLIEVADMIARLVSKCEMPINAPFAESYLNGKLELARYYLAYQWKLYGMMTGLWAVEILALAVPLVGAVGNEFGNYGLAAPIIPLLMVSRIAVSTIHFSDGVMLGADHPEMMFYALLLQRSVGLVTRYLFLVVWEFGWAGIPLAEIPEFYSKVVFAWVLIHKKILKVRVPLWQSFGASALAGLGLWGVNAVVLEAFFPPLVETLGLIPGAAILLALALFGFPFLVYFPLYGLFGGWDDQTLDDFRAAMKISGPSKPFVFLFYHGTRLGARLSPLTNKFPLPSEAARREAEELIAAQKRLKS